MKSAIMIMLGLAMIGFIGIGDAAEEFDRMMKSMSKSIEELNKNYHEGFYHTKTEMNNVRMDLLLTFQKVIHDATKAIAKFVDAAKKKGKNRALCGSNGRAELAKEGKDLFTSFEEFFNEKEKELTNQPQDVLVNIGGNTILALASGMLNLNEANAVTQTFQKTVDSTNEVIKWMFPNALTAVKTRVMIVEGNLHKVVTQIKKVAKDCTNQRGSKYANLRQS